MSTSSGLPVATARPVGEKDQAVGELAGQGEVVQGAEHGEASLAAQRVDQLEGLDPPAEVERAGGLVEEQDRRLLGQGPGEHQTLQLPARQGGEAALRHGAEVEGVEELRAHPSVLGGLEAEVPDVRGAAEQHVVADGHVRWKHGLLGDVGDEARQAPG